MTLPRKVLIANRGEIVVRVARTCREMGIATVAVASDVDAEGLHARSCDEVVRLSGSAPSDTYLRSDLLLDAARRVGADAVHPGFGFLAEDPRFARAVIDAGLTWVGPGPEAIAAMGDKLEAKRTMREAGVPLLPSVAVHAQLAHDELLALADDIGFPLIVKAAAGGGGKGMRVVHDRVDLVDAVAAASREAVSAFGDDRVFLERYVTRPRHLEVQVIGDAEGNVLHLFERECSIQRRHQKVVEESPSPAIDDGVRAALTDAATAAARAIDYLGAGTVEFVADESLLARRRAGEDIDPRTTFAFLEMNTRLQVEHPVTEDTVRIAGATADEPLDLVRLQLLVASGAPLPFTQADVSQRGHAIEVRLYAEDPAADYLPATGHLDVFRPDPSVRWDVGIAEGEDVTPFYDPMLAKAIAWAPTRGEAAAKLAAALGRTPVAGVTTNQDLLIAILDDLDFLVGDTTTSYLEDRGELLLAAPDRQLVERAAIAVALHDAMKRHADQALLPSLPIAFAPSATFDRQIVLDRDDPVVVRYRQQRDGSWRVKVDHQLDPDAFTPLVQDGDTRDVRAVASAPDHLDVEVGGVRTRTSVFAAGDARLVSIGGRWIRFALRPRFPVSEQALAEGASTAPMPGKVTSLAVAVGDEVEVGALLLTVEAMKMEHRVTAALDGTVAEVRVQVGDQVDTGQIVVVIEAGEASEGAAS